MSGTKRPAHLDLDGYRGADIESAVLPLDEQSYRSFLKPVSIPPTQAPAELVRQAADKIVAAKRPLLVVGVGADEPGIRDALAAFASRFQLPIGTSVGGRSLVETSHPLHFGVLGTYSAPYANEVLYDADLVIYVGCHVSDQITCDWSNPKLGTDIIQIDVDPAELGRNYPNVLGLAGNPVQVVNQIAALDIPQVERSDWLARCADTAARWYKSQEIVTRSEATPIRAERLAAELSECLPDDAVVVADTGFSATWTAQFTEFRHPTQTYLRAAGSLGWAFPAAIGAKFGASQRPVVCFTGDGALHYHLSELETVRRWNLPLVTVVNNNSALGQGLRSVKKLYEGRAGKLDDLVLFERLDFARIAEAFGIRARRIEKATDIVPVIREAIAANEPFLVDVMTDPDCNPQPAWIPQA
jgi:acetolactate synthase-1/2/3 large subunit